MKDIAAMGLGVSLLFVQVIIPLVIACFHPSVFLEMKFYHNNGTVTNLTLHEGDSVTVECRVLPYLPSTSTCAWDEDTRDGDSHNLIIESANKGHSKTYTCTAENDGIVIQKTFTIEGKLA